MRVLFIGNSHTYFHDMPAGFVEMVEALTGKRPEVTMLAFSGRSLEWHCEEYFSLRFALLYGRYDFCVIQQQAHHFPGEEKTAPYVGKIVGLCRKTGTKPVLLMTWAERGHPEQLAEMSRVYRKLAKENGALLLPVGELFAQLGRTHPEIELHWKDGGHASPYGSYLIAATAARILTGIKDLSHLSSIGRDFRVQFDTPDQKPTAEEDPEKIRFSLDPQKAAAIRAAISDLPD